MRVAIDKLGRIVVPKPIRERYHLYPGAELELETEANGIQLSLISPKGTLVRKHGVLVHHGAAVVDFDIAGFINTERDALNGYMVAEEPTP
jgi:AbrB family looped-hinge helix DNA binding protein